MYCCKECRLNDLKKKTTTLNENNYTLEFKNRKPLCSHSFYKTKNSPVLTTVNSDSQISPLLKVKNLSTQKNSTLIRNNSFGMTSSSNSSNSSNSEFPIVNTVTVTNKPNQSMTIYSSPPKEAYKLPSTTTQLQRPRYYVQTFHSQNINRNKRQENQQLMTPLSEKDHMEYENTSNIIYNTSQKYSEEVNENSNHWYWSSDSDDEDDE